jgi:hypothetical protein
MRSKVCKRSALEQLRPILGKPTSGFPASVPENTNTSCWSERWTSSKSRTGRPTGRIDAPSLVSLKRRQLFSASISVHFKLMPSPRRQPVRANSRMIDPADRKRSSSLARCLIPGFDDGTYIRMRQSKGRGSKGRRRVTVPVGPPLRAALDAALKEKRARPSPFW